jgi:hypothetical protein
MIVAFLAESVKAYTDRFLHFLDNLLVCPRCQGKCKRHGWRERKARTREETVILRVLRIFCPYCHRTFTILPDFLKPYGRYIQDVRQEAILAQLAGVPAEQAAGPGPAVETVRRWLVCFKAIREEAAAALRSLLAQLGHFPPLGRSSLPDLIHEIALAIPGVAYSCLFGLANMLLGQAERPVWI